MISVQHTIDDFLHLFFPHVCAGCGTDMIGEKALLCIACMEALPFTNFHLHAQNPAEKMFRGRVPVERVSSFLYFAKDSLVQRLLHGLKYKGNTALGYLLGNMMGAALQSSSLWSGIDVLVPLPLHPAKEKKRGYNQALVLCEGMAAAMNISICAQAVLKRSHTESQTKKHRLERWQNMEGRFAVTNPALLENKRVLLIDDVMTTGATIEACGREILQVPGTALNIATLAYTVK
ncbi:MAG: ComF family protein [Williamsia sp.]|nr:ComF family protein [Williamsia sp.]